MSTLCHFSAGLGAASAGFGALSAMVHVRCVFLALSRAGFTQVGAELTHVSRVNTTTGHERNGRIADSGAVAVEPDTVHHHHNILFAKTGVGAGIATNGAILAGIDAFPVLLGG